MECCNKELQFEKRVDRIGIYQAQCSTCNHYYQKRTFGKIIYINTNGSNWVCNSCGGELSGAKVSHPVHNKEFTLELTGSGRVYTEIVPYCPKCEAVPNSNGSFV